MGRPMAQSEITKTLRQLGLGERLFVWGFRAIAQHHRLGRPRMSEVRCVYDHFQVADAVSSLNAMLETFACTAHSTVELHCPGCPCVSGSEYLISQATAAVQRGEIDLARQRFSNWLPDISTDWILSPASGLGRIFALHGLLLPLHATAFISLPATMAKQTWPVGAPIFH